MRRITLIAAVAVTMLPLAGLAQQTTGTVTGSPPPSTLGLAPPAMGTPANPNVVPEQGGPLHPASQTGRDVVADDGVSTKTVRAVPCGTAARETDGTTTCIGIPGASERRRR
jgi:hypothetical protein